MKNYLLSLFTPFDSEDSIQSLVEELSKVVDSERIKYHQTKFALILYFGSEVEQTELYDYITGLCYGKCETFLMTELTDKSSVHLPEKIKAYLLDLESSNVEYQESDLDFSEMANEFVEYLLQEMDKEVPTPTLNELLDKISDRGINSLTPFEKEILEEYSKN